MRLFLFFCAEITRPIFLYKKSPQCDNLRKKGGAKMQTIFDKKLLILKIESIKPSRNQPRKSFDEYDLKNLSESIRTSGIIQPLSVRRTGDGLYELIAGERRLKAAKMAGLKKVPCVLHKTDESTAAVYSIIENLQRKNLTPFEEAQGLQSLIEKFSLSQNELAERLGMAQSTLSNKLRILRLDETVRTRVIAASLTERHARALLRLPKEKHHEALDRIIAECMTLKQTENLIEEMLEEKNPDRQLKVETEEKPLRKYAIGDMRLFSNSLSKLIDTLQNAGINAHSRKYETDKYIEYKVRIAKEPTCDTATQLTLALKE